MAGAQVLFRRFLRWSAGYVPKGPVCDLTGDTQLRSLLPAIHGVARQRRAAFLVLEPNVELPSPAGDLLSAAGLRAGGRSVQPSSTIKLDIRGTEESLLAAMKPKTRYNIRLAQRHGVLVREGDCAADLSHFSQMMEETGRRDGFGVHTPEYYRRAWEVFRPAGLGVLLLAEHDGDVLAGIMVFRFGGEAIYMYGASSNEKRNLMPNHLLQWEGIRWAKARGCRTYDLWGVPPEVRAGEPAGADAASLKDGLWGVYRFKSGFGGSVVNYLPAYEIAYNRFLYWLWRRSKAPA